MGSDADNPITRLSSIAAWMREVGATELAFDGVHIKLGPQPRVIVSESSSEQPELSDEEKREAAMSPAEREHYTYWRRLTRSSGAPIPKYRPRAQ